MSLHDLRRDYDGAPLDERSADADPFRQFALWFTAARDQETDPTAMALASADRDGRPSVRMVLLKGFDDRGFVFYTNYGSRKAGELEPNPRAALLFYWPARNRQVRIEGTVGRVSAQESDEYFASRPPESRIAAVVSPQSRPLTSRADLEARFEQIRTRYPEADMARPESWGGYRVTPDAFEFWQGRPSRLHDRVRYEPGPGGDWTRSRLAP